MVQNTNSMKSILYPSCREATRLITERLDRKLTFAERTGLRFHLAICAACPKVVRQIDIMREALARWRKHVDED